MNMANMAPPPHRLVMIDGEGKLRSAQGERIDMIADAPFTIENEQMTPSLKIRRHVIGKAYGERLEALYRR